MTYNWARWLPEALEAEGVRVKLEPGWANRGRWRLDGRRDLPPNWDFEPNGEVVWHHTASLSSAGNPWPTGRTLVAGRSDLPGPLCQGSPAFDGVVHIVAAGRANHAGEMSGFGPTTRGADGNATAIGFEIDMNGTQKMPRAQYRASIRCAAAVNRRFHRDSSWSMGHKETSVTGKWDPGVGGHTVDLAAWRRDVAECLSYPAGVWQSASGPASWGEVRLGELRENGEAATVKKLQYRLRNTGRAVPDDLKKALRVNGRWDAATTAACAAWQANAFAPGPDPDGYQGGSRLGPRQAEKLFGNRYRLIRD